MTSLAPVLQAFFTQRLQKQCDASSNTIIAYRDTFRLLLSFVLRQTGKAPTKVLLADLDAPLIIAFLDYLQNERKNSVTSRNMRLVAIRSFFRFAATRHPDHLAIIQGVLNIPSKRFDRKVVTFLNRDEIEALLKAPDRDTWIGQRDYTLILIAIQTGLRVSELTGLCIKDLVFEGIPYIRCLGKGRKERVTPLTRQCCQALRAWLTQCGSAQDDPVFPSRRRTSLSRDAVERLLKKYTSIAAHNCHTLQQKKVTPHVLRHTTAVQLLQSGTDLSTIALWLGHESVQTTQIYLDADLSIKQRALERLTPPGMPNRRYKPGDELLAFLNSL